MPQYQNPQLAQLFQLAQLNELLSKGDTDQQQVDQQGQTARMTAAIHLMGLQQEQENQAAAREQTAKALEETRNYHQGELAHLSSVLDQTKLDRSATTDANVIDRILSDPQVPWSEKQQYVATRPSLAPVVKAGHDRAIQEALPKVTQLLQTAYGTPSIASDPAKLDAVKAAARAMNPDAYDSIDHEALKSHLPAAVGDGTGSTTPGYSPVIQGALGKQLKYLPIGTANLGALAYNKLLVPPTNLINSLVGAPPLQTQPYAPLDYGRVFANLLKPQSQYNY